MDHPNAMPSHIFFVFLLCHYLPSHHTPTHDWLTQRCTNVLNYTTYRTNTQGMYHLGHLSYQNAKTSFKHPLFSCKLFITLKFTCSGSGVRVGVKGPCAQSLSKYVIKNGYQRRPDRFHVSWPPCRATGSFTGWLIQRKQKKGRFGTK